MEELREYIQQVLAQKGLSILQVEKRSGGKIKDSYIRDILDGKTKAISVEKLNALAEGLGVDGLELYKLASGKQAVFKYEDPWPNSVLIKAIEAITSNPDLTKIIKALLKMKPAEIKAILKIVESEKNRLVLCNFSF